MKYPTMWPPPVIRCYKLVSLNPMNTIVRYRYHKPCFMGVMSQLSELSWLRGRLGTPFFFPTRDMMWPPRNYGEPNPQTAKTPTDHRKPWENVGFMGFIADLWWLSWWCNNHLEKYEFVNGKDDIPYMKWKNKSHVPNHQPVVGSWLWTLDFDNQKTIG